MLESRKEITAFTTAKNICDTGYPIWAAVAAAHAVAEEVVVGVANNCDDATYAKLDALRQDFHWLKVVEVAWPNDLVRGHSISTSVNETIKHIRTPWRLYFQLDELIEPVGTFDLSSTIPQTFKYTHFMFNKDTITTHPRFYEKEIRLFHESSGLYSYGDGQGFRVHSNQYPEHIDTNHKMLHYGWVRSPYEAAKKYIELAKMFSSIKNPKTFEEAKRASVDILSGDYSDHDQFLREIAVHIQPFRGNHSKYIGSWLDTKVIEPDHWIKMFIYKLNKERELWFQKSVDSHS